MKKLILILLLTNIAHADTFADTRAEIGCYKANNDDRCIEVTRIDCGDVPITPLTRAQRMARISQNVTRYGAVIANFCDDLEYSREQVNIDQEYIHRFYNQIRRLRGQIAALRDAK